MLRYIINRLLLMIPTLLGVAVLVFFLLRMMPGDIVELKLLAEGGNVDVATLDAERARLGLDKSMWNQFVDWMVGLVTFDFGISMWTGRPVVEEISSRLELSLQVAIMATVLAILIAIPFGTLSALFKDTWIDHVIRVFAIAGLAVPSFWLGMVIILVLLLNFNWIPPLTYTPIYEDPWKNLAQLIWPALAVGYRYSAVATRMMRSTILEVLQEDPLFKGISPGDYVYFVHSFAAPVSNASLAVSDYGGRFTAAVRRDNFRGVQFHPERSAAVGGKEPFDLPARWRERKAKLDLATPFDFVSTADMIGGNSGSPVLNRAGELVGINFDRNRHGLVRNFVYTDVQARHIAVHSRAVVEALRKLYGADALADELTGRE